MTGKLVIAGVLLVVALNGTSLAGEFSGRAGLGFLVSEQADNLSGRGYRTVDGNRRPRSFWYLIPVGLAEVRYADREQTVTFGTSVDDPAGVTLGYRRKLEQGAVGGSLFYSIFGSEWKNPYLFGAPRSDTMVHSYGARLFWDEIQGGPFSLSIRGTGKRVANDLLSGDLRRSGLLLDTELTYRHRLNDEWSLTPLLGYQRGQYDGSANNFHGATFGAGAGWHRDSLSAAARVVGLLAEHERRHPVFGTRRQDLGYRASAQVTWGGPFGWRNWFLTAGAIHGRTDSSIDFFATRATYGYSLLGYQF